MVLQYFTILLQYVRKASVYNNFTTGSQGAYSQYVRKARFCNVHTETLFPVLILLHTQGELGSGLTFILSLQILLLYLNSICQQRDLPSFLVTVAGEFHFLFILFWEGKGDWGYLYFLSPRKGF